MLTVVFYFCILLKFSMIRNRNKLLIAVQHTQKGAYTLSVSLFEFSQTKHQSEQKKHLLYTHRDDSISGVTRLFQAHLVLFSAPDLQSVTPPKSSPLSGKVIFRGNNLDAANTHHVTELIIVCKAFQWTELKNSHTLFFFFEKMHHIFIPIFPKLQIQDYTDFT